MKRVLFSSLIMLIMGAMGAVLYAAATLSPDDVPRMTKEQLKAQLGNADLVIIDVRASHDWQDSKMKIKGSIREDPQNATSWINKYPTGKTIVLYCA